MTKFYALIHITVPEAMRQEAYLEWDEYSAAVIKDIDGYVLQLPLVHEYITIQNQVNPNWV